MIPDDIITLACDAHSFLQKAGAIPKNSTDDAPAVHIIARVILAERQRCAEVARAATYTVYMHWDPDTPLQRKVDHREVIAKAILAPVTP